MVRYILRLEGAVVLLASIWFFFFQIDGNWLLFVLLILVPDVSMVGFVKGAKVGSITYNLAHNYMLALAVIVGGVAADNTLTTSLGLILSAHVGMDCLLGYGLKYPTHFKDTHVQRV